MAEIRGRGVRMKLSENLNMFNARALTTSRLIPDGDPKPEIGDILTIHKSGQKPMRAKIVSIACEVRQHKCTLVTYNIQPIGKKTGFGLG